MPNYYGPQRFGVCQNNHHLGKLLVLGKYDLFIKNYLTTSKNESQEIQDIRRKISENYDNLVFCRDLVKGTEELSSEFELLENLLIMDKISAIKSMKLSKFFVQSYVSYLFNLALSKSLSKDYIDSDIIRIGNKSSLDDFNYQLYKDILKSERIKLSDFKKCDFELEQKYRKTLFFPQNFSYKVEERDITLEFDLGIGEYASLFLDFIVVNDKFKLN